MTNKLIEVHYTKDKMPECHQTVIVDGGIAVWTGKVWLSQMPDCCGRVIGWEVEWWIPLIHQHSFLLVPGDRGIHPLAGNRNRKTRQTILTLGTRADEKQGGAVVF